MRLPCRNEQVMRPWRAEYDTLGSAILGSYPETNAAAQRRGYTGRGRRDRSPCSHTAVPACLA